MRKEAIIGIVIVALAVGAFVFRPKGGTTEIPGLTGAYSLQDVIALNKSMQCDFERADESSEVKGTIYVSEGRVRGDFDISAATIDDEFESHFITRDNTTYTWTSLLPTGYQTPVVSSASSSSSPTAQASIVGLNDKVEYKCSDWEEKPGTFDLPKDIEFKAL